jgi:hypothetical protein
LDSLKITSIEIDNEKFAIDIEALERDSYLVDKECLHITGE